MKRRFEWLEIICIQIDKNQPNNFYVSVRRLHALLAVDPYALYHINGEPFFFKSTTWWLYNCWFFLHWVETFSWATAMIYGQSVKRHEMWSNKSWNWNFMSSEHDRLEKVTSWNALKSYLVISISTQQFVFDYFYVFLSLSLTCDIWPKSRKNNILNNLILHGNIFLQPNRWNRA